MVRARAGQAGRMRTSDPRQLHGRGAHLQRQHVQPLQAALEGLRLRLLAEPRRPQAKHAGVVWQRQRGRARQGRRVSSRALQRHAPAA